MFQLNFLFLLLLSLTLGLCFMLQCCPILLNLEALTSFNFKQVANLAYESSSFYPSLGSERNWFHWKQGYLYFNTICIAEEREWICSIVTFQEASYCIEVRNWTGILRLPIAFIFGLFLFITWFSMSKIKILTIIYDIYIYNNVILWNNMLHHIWVLKWMQFFVM